MVKERELNVVVIATAASKQLLHASLLQSKGKHVFSVVVELPPPDLVHSIYVHVCVFVCMCK